MPWSARSPARCAGSNASACSAMRGATHFIEVGPGKVLTGLNRQIDRALITMNVEDPASLEKTIAALTA